MIKSLFPQDEMTEQGYCPESTERIIIIADTVSSKEIKLQTGSLTEETLKRHHILKNKQLPSK